MNINWNERWNFSEETKTGLLNSINELTGEVLDRVDGLKVGSEIIDFYTKSGKIVRLYHSQECCECVDLEDFESDIKDFSGATVILAEEVSGEAPANGGEYAESETWTFYKVETNKGGLWLRWYGESNGYYSESVDVICGVIQE